MGSPIANLLMGQSGGVDLSPEGLARQAALAHQEAEAKRMADLAAGGALAPPTGAVQDINAMVQAGQQNPQIGALATLLTKLSLAGGAPGAAPPRPAATPAPPQPSALDEEIRRRKNSGQDTGGLQ